MRRQSLSNTLATWIVVLLLAVTVLYVVFGVDLASLVGLAQNTPVAPVFSGIVPTRATVYTIAPVPPAPAQPVQQVAPRVEYIMITAAPAIQPVEQTATPLGGLGASSEPVIMVVTVTPELATAAPLPTGTPLATAPLPALPEYGPYTKEQYDTCFDIYNAGRLAELPEPQEAICLGYVGAGD